MTKRIRRKFTVICNTPERVTRINCRISTDIRSRCPKQTITVVMSHPQFHCKIFTLRHAWLNLRDKHMTTGRINQVIGKRLMFDNNFMTQAPPPIFQYPPAITAHQQLQNSTSDPKDRPRNIAPANVCLHRRKLLHSRSSLDIHATGIQPHTQFGSVTRVHPHTGAKHQATQHQRPSVLSILRDPLLLLCCDEIFTRTHYV